MVGLCEDKQVCIPAPPLSICIILSKLLHLSEPGFSHPQHIISVPISSILLSLKITKHIINSKVWCIKH